VIPVRKKNQPEFVIVREEKGVLTKHLIVNDKIKGD